jgi:hypothetical protein
MPGLGRTNSWAKTGKGPIELHKKAIRAIMGANGVRFIIYIKYALYIMKNKSTRPLLGKRFLDLDRQNEYRYTWKPCPPFGQANARVAELVYAYVSEAYGESLESSNLSSGTFLTSFVLAKVRLAY